MVLKARNSSTVIPVGCPMHNANNSSSMGGKSMSGGGGGGCPVMMDENEKKMKSYLEQREIEKVTQDSWATIYSILLLKVFVIIVVAIILYFMEDLYEAQPGTPLYEHYAQQKAAAEAASASASSAAGHIGMETGTMGAMGSHHF